MPDPHSPPWLMFSHFLSLRRRLCNSLSVIENTQTFVLTKFVGMVNQLHKSESFFFYCCFIFLGYVNMGCEHAVRKRWKERINTSHGIRNRMQIDCLTEIKLLASN